MSLKTRGLVFATFFGSCCIIGLLIGSLTTDYWILAQAKRHNTTASDGKINFGLFSGIKNLNVGYGWRQHDIKVLDIMGTDVDQGQVGSYWLWLGTVLGTGLALFSSALGAVVSVIKTASQKSNSGSMILLMITNFSSGFTQIMAFICWLVQFYNYLTHNVLVAEDVENLWYTKNMVTLGHSFYFIVIGILLTFVNVTFLLLAIRCERRERRRIEPPCDEKMQGAIMLY